MGERNIRASFFFPLFVSCCADVTQTLAINNLPFMAQTPKSEQSQLKNWLFYCLDLGLGGEESSIKSSGNHNSPDFYFFFYLQQLQG